MVSAHQHRKQAHPPQWRMPPTSHFPAPQGQSPSIARRPANLFFDGKPHCLWPAALAASHPVADNPLAVRSGFIEKYVFELYLW